jgi:hypothetical protein
MGSASAEPAADSGGGLAADGEQQRPTTRSGRQVAPASSRQRVAAATGRQQRRTAGNQRPAADGQSQRRTAVSVGEQLAMAGNGRQRRWRVSTADNPQRTANSIHRQRTARRGDRWLAASAISRQLPAADGELRQPVADGEPRPRTPVSDGGQPIPTAACCRYRRRRPLTSDIRPGKPPQPHFPVMRITMLRFWLNVEPLIAYGRSRQPIRTTVRFRFPATPRKFTYVSRP